MEQNVFEWKSEYKIGVENIDKAHQQIFSIVSRIISNLMDENFEKNKLTCIEAIKYLKNYTIKHFAEEEAYQLAIGYPGYRRHKQIHDNMRDVVVPSLKRELESSGYSRTAMEHFIGICAGWLVAHILIDDQAITGKESSRWTYTADSESVDKLEQVVKALTGNVFQIKSTLVSKHYDGFELGEAYYFEIVYSDEKGKTHTASVGTEKKLMLKVLGDLMCIDADDLDREIMIPMIMELNQVFTDNVAKAFFSETVTRIDSKFLQRKEFYSKYEKHYPDYSLLWRTEYGYLAFCLSSEENRETSENNTNT